MNKPFTTENLLPRPVERLPEYAHAKSRQALAEKLIDTFRIAQASATAVANAVVDPSEVRKYIGEPTDPDVERIPVPGGMLLGIRTSVWSRRVMPDPRNPRTLPSRRHPFAIEPGTGAEDSKFRPVPEPRSLDTSSPHSAELAVDIESRHHLTWAAQMAAGYVLAENDWRASIASQGVMEAVWLVATTYQHSNGTDLATTLTSAEGSSRTTAVHNLLDVRSADVAYDTNESGLRAHIRKLNEAFDRGANEVERIALRCERIPALILVGFQPHATSQTTFPTAVKSLVALRHVDPPKPWGEGPENESLADEVLDELYREDLISATQRDYFAGACTRAEAKGAHLPDDPVLRATQIVQLFASKDPRVNDAIRIAVTSQSTRKRITPKLLNELATALTLRALAEDRGKVDQIRRYLRHAYGKSVHRAAWRSTARAPDQLVTEALAEARAAIGVPGTEEPGPASLELAVRASYPLVVSGSLNADRGSAGNEQPDRRNPGEVLDAMRRTVQGVYQLGQALHDFAENNRIRAVDEQGHLKRLTDGSDYQTVNDIYLRREFQPPGKAKAASPGDTPIDHYNHALSKFGATLQALEEAFDALSKVAGDNGQPMVEVRGVEPRLTESWRELLGRVDEEMVVWSRTFRRTFGTKVGVPEGDDEEENRDADPYEQVGEQGDDDWFVRESAASEEAQ
jgi:hypothetical protein